MEVKRSSKFKFLFLSISCCLFILNFTSAGQLPKRLKFDHITAREGLSDNVITCIMQDQKGFVWLGTYQGLCRYDGYGFVNFHYEENNPNSLQDNIVSCLLEDHQGKIWVGSTPNGLSQFDPNTEQFTRFQSGIADSFLISNPSILHLFEDSENQLWIGTQYGLTVLSPDRSQSKKYYYSADGNGLNGEMVYDIIEDKRGRIWLATDAEKLCVFNKTTEQFSEMAYTKVSSSNQQTNRLKNFYLYQDSILWIASNRGGLSSLNIETATYQDYEINQNLNSPIRDIIEVDRTLWLATDGAGLVVFDLASKEMKSFNNQYYDDYSLGSNALWSLYKDRQGIVWVGTYQAGLSRYDPLNNFYHLIKNHPAKANTLPHKPILSLFEDSKNRVWAGTDWGGLHQITEDGFRIQSLTTKEGLPTNVIKSLSEDHLGNLLIGTYNHGLSRFNVETTLLESFKEMEENAQALPNNNVWYVYTDSKGISWLGTLGDGIVRFDAASKSFSSPPIDYQNGGLLHINHIFEDGQSNLWFSSDGGIIYYQRRTDTWQTFSLSERFQLENHDVNNVKAVFEDGFRHIWMATDIGLLKYFPNQDTFSLFDLDYGLPEVPVLAMIDDGFGNLLLVSQNYISQFDLSKETVTSYQLTNNSFMNNISNAYLQRPNGDIMIGGKEGITLLDPKKLRKNDYLPPVYFTEFRLNNQVQTASTGKLLVAEANELAQLQLNYDHSVIDISYTALNYTESERNQFAYQLEGFDNDWRYVENRRTATYTNLDPGTYIFRVKASNNHGVWNTEGAAIKLIVHPPFWDTYWFKIGLFLLIACGLYYLQRMRIRQIKRIYALRSLNAERQIITEKNDSLEKELNAAKSELENVTMSYIHKNEKLQKIRQKIYEATKRTTVADKRLLDHIVKDIDKEIQDSDYWDLFEHQFNKSHDNFLERFKQAFPDLSQRELRICAYLRMGLANQEIATLMNVTVGTIGTFRYRIRKKIKLEERKSMTKMILRF